MPAAILYCYSLGSHFFTLFDLSLFRGICIFSTHLKYFNILEKKGNHMDEKTKLLAYLLINGCLRWFLMELSIPDSDTGYPKILCHDFSCEY